MKRFKTKVWISLVSLLLATAMLSVSSFAWFTLSTNPEMTGLTATVTANDNFEIAFAGIGTTAALPAPSSAGDSGNDFTWGNLVALSGSGTGGTAYAAFLEGFEGFRPITLTGEDDTRTGAVPGTFQYPVYIGNGRVEEYEDIIEEDTYGIGLLYYEYEESDEGENENGNGNEEEPVRVVCGFFLDFWLRTNQEDEEEPSGLPVVLTDADKRSSGGVDGGGSHLILNLPESAKEALENASQNEGGSGGGSGGAETEDPLETYRMLITSLHIAFRDVTPSGIEGAEAAPENAPIITPVVSDSVTETEDTLETDLSSSTVILRLKKNQAKLLRMYIYLEGAEVYGEDDGEELDGTDKLHNISPAIPLEDFTCLLGVQFALYDRELHSMDEEPAET